MLEVTIRDLAETFEGISAGGLATLQSRNQIQLPRGPEGGIVLDTKTAVILYLLGQLRRLVRGNRVAELVGMVTAALVDGGPGMLLANLQDGSLTPLASASGAPPGCLLLDVRDLAAKLTDRIRRCELAQAEASAAMSGVGMTLRTVRIVRTHFRYKR